MGLEYTSDQALVLTKAIQGGCVKQGDAPLQRREQDALTLFSGDRRTIGVAEIHATQANGADGQGANFSLLHGLFFFPMSMWCRYGTRRSFCTQPGSGSGRCKTSSLSHSVLRRARWATVLNGSCW